MLAGLPGARYSRRRRSATEETTMIELGIVMDPVETLNRKKDSTLAMILAARRRGWRVRYILQGDLASVIADRAEEVMVPTKGQ